MIYPLDMTPEDWQSLTDLAEATRSFATRGKNTGKPSPRALITRLARDKSAQRALIDHYTVQGTPLDLPQATILRPPEPVSKTLVWLTVHNSSIRLMYPEIRENFGILVKRLGYTWQEPYWERTVPPQVIVHRVAEAAHVLVANGYCVVPPSAAIAKRVISGDYEQETTRSIRVMTKGDYLGWFVIVWPRHENFYDAARRITASRYHRPHVVVPPEHYAEVLDFADRYGFTLSERAQQRVAEAEAMLTSALLLDLPSDELEDSIPTLEPEENGIDDELADDPL